MSMQFVQALADEMAAKGLTQSALAELVNVKQHTVSRWLARTGYRPEPPRNIVFDLENVLGLDPGELSRHLGYMPIGASVDICKITDAITAAPELEEWQKDVMRDIYRTLTRPRPGTATGKRRRTATG